MNERAGMERPGMERPGIEPPGRGSATARNLVLVLGARTALIGASFLGMLLVIRALGPGDYGGYAMCLTFIRISTGFLGDPLDFAVLRRVPRDLSADRPRAFAVLRAAFALRLGGGLVVALTLAVLAPVVVRAFIDAPGAAGLVRLAAAGIVGELLLRSATGYLQASEAFPRMLALEAMLQLGRFAAILALLAAGAATSRTVLAAYVAAPYAAFALGLAFVPRPLLAPSLAGRRDLAEVFRYSRWMAIAFAVAAVYERLDVLLLGHFRGSSEVGVYSAALALAMIPDFVAGTVGTVLQPRVVRLYAAGEFGRFNRRYLRWALPLAIAGALAVLGLAPWAISTFLTARYAAAIPVFQILALGALFWAATTPLPAALLSLVAPKRVLLVSAAGLAGLAALGALAIPRFGVMGAAGAVVAMRLVLGTWIARLGARMAGSVPPAAGAPVSGEPAGAPAVAPCG